MPPESLSTLPGLGPKRSQVLASAGVRTLWDLARYVPRTWIDRSRVSVVAECVVDTEAVVVGTVVRASAVPGPRMRFQAVLQDDRGDELTLVFFQSAQWWTHRLQKGMRVVAMGRVQHYRGAQMVHPELQWLAGGDNFVGGWVPVYPLSEEMRTAGMEQRFFRKLLPELMARPAPQNQEGAVPDCLQRLLQFAPEWENLRRLHNPSSWQDIQGGRRQLKMEELLPPCLRMTERRLRRLARGQGRTLDRQRMALVRDALPFSLTEAQETCLEELLGGMESDRQYHALLQGDVGSGKTAVALLALAAVCTGGNQGVLMAPTDILARQHFAWMEERLASAGVRCALLVGSTPASERQRILAELAQGSIAVLIGTHAVFSEGVRYVQLALVVVDEQHRFGVGQREKLLAKGDAPDLLVMSATPIPRSLAMTLYGDLETVVLGQKPPGRLDVRTRLVDAARRPEMLSYIHRECLEGNRCYWIAPRVAEDGGVGSVEALEAELARYSTQWKVAVVHGRLDSAVRDARLADFACGRAQVLIATTVVEVGVNVPEANLMVIESPERFGLAQLHQLRGRVGRGTVQAWCFLPVQNDNPARERLEEFAATTDGFDIAELDLRTRGAGDLEGQDQSGAWIFRHFDWLEDRDLIQETLQWCGRLLGQNAVLSEQEIVELRGWYTRIPGPEDGAH